MPVSNRIISPSLNFFDPNKDIPAAHENQLTRAFLVVLSLSPAAHQVWLSLVKESLKLPQLPRPWHFWTQRRQMMDLPPQADEPILGISVLLAADPPAVGGSVQFSDRVQILDGIIRYGDELLIVIETKLDGLVPTWQAEELNRHGANVCFEKEVRLVSWRDLLAAWTDLLERDIVAGTEQLIIDDFLTFVDHYFPHLGPYTTLAKCQGHALRVNRRLKAVLNEIAGGTPQDWLELKDRSAVNRAYLVFEESSNAIRLDLYPAPTLTQAKQFYTRPQIAPSVLSLCARGWLVRPYFRLAYMATDLATTTVEASLEEYLDYWSANISSAKKVPRGEWEEFWRILLQRRFATTQDKSIFDEEFTKTNRHSATPRPGLMCSWFWKLDEATLLDSRGRFAVSVRHSINEALAALGESILTP